MQMHATVVSFTQFKVDGCLEYVKTRVGHMKVNIISK